MGSSIRIGRYHGPAGGWGSVHSLLRFGARPEVPVAQALRQLGRQNKPGGAMCVSCAWAKPADPHAFEFCENGAKATFWELDTGRVDAEFFARHTVSELRQWPDHDLERAGRLTRPMRYDAASDRYLPISWEAAFALAGSELRRLTPDSAVFYASGRASLETSYMYALLARLYGTNNLPDSSNMCHETTSLGLPRSIGVPVGTVYLEDFDRTDCILAFGQNVGTNSPRMLHKLQEASRRGVPIIAFNPLRERGWERFTNPQSPVEMLGGRSTPIASRYLQVRAGGDVAALRGLCKALLERRDGGDAAAVDEAFIATHTQGWEAFAADLRDCDWPAIERESGLAAEALREVAGIYAGARASIAVYGMGLTQHRHGVDNVRMLCNLLLMRGNIGREGAGICPVRGHSNVQGQRSVGITEKPELAPLDRLAGQYRFAPPRHKGLDTIGTVEGILDGSVKAFVGLGGNFARAAPDTRRLEAAWSALKLSVHVATKLNRSHLLGSKVALLLPCLGRLERDLQASGEQLVTVEDSTAWIHASRGTHPPASDDLRSEVAIVAGLAQATVPSSAVPWQDWVDDYTRIRDAIEATYPEDFRDFNTRMHVPGGFPRPIAARERRWETPGGKAQFHVPDVASTTGFDDAPGRFRLITLRSNDQFNTTIYGYRDRFRGIEGTRAVVMMRADDMQRLGIRDGDAVRLVTDHPDDGEERSVGGLRAVPYDLPEGCIASYFPECNPLLPVSHHAVDSHVPAAKSIPVRIHPDHA